VSPSTAEALAVHVRDAPRVDVPLFGGEGLSFAALRGEIRHDVADGVVSSPAGTTLSELNAELARHGRCVPCVPVWPPDVDDLARLVLLGLPHAAEATHGTWRDWIVGATMVTADGTIVRSGSRVVKSVAGYDAHKLLVGSRGALLLPSELTLRTFPIFPASYPQGVQSWVDNLRSIWRVEPVDASAGQRALGADALWTDQATGTLWTARLVQDLPPFPNAWSLDPFCPMIREAVLPLHRRAKAVLDPGGKLAPGAFHNL
jgi:FAD/FMN-containing dehydrogenase